MVSDVMQLTDPEGIVKVIDALISFILRGTHSRKWTIVVPRPVPSLLFLYVLSR